MFARLFFAFGNLDRATAFSIHCTPTRYLPQVRSSVLDALVLLLDKGGRMLKAFVPQMQTSLVKNLKDAYAPVRATALKALKRLLRLSTRIDPLVSVRTAWGEVAARLHCQ